MKRRNFLAALAALPFAGCALFKQFRRKPDQVALRFKPEQIVHVNLGSERKVFYPYGVSTIDIEPFEIVNPALSDSERFGRVYRRVLRHPDVYGPFVQSATVLRNGDLQVTCWDAHVPSDWVGTEFDKHTRFLKRATRRIDERGIGLLDATLPRDEWTVVQYDENGDASYDITWRDCC